jgi:hypothetical protein
VRFLSEINHMTRFSPAFVAGGSLVASAVACGVLSQSVSAERTPALARNAFQTASKLVTTAVTVRERDGRLVTNLGERDFVIEDGHPQALARRVGGTLSVAIAIDTSQSVRGEQLQATRAAVQRSSKPRCDRTTRWRSSLQPRPGHRSWTLDHSPGRAWTPLLRAAARRFDAVFKTLSLFTARSLSAQPSRGRTVRTAPATRRRQFSETAHRHRRVSSIAVIAWTRVPRPASTHTSRQWRRATATAT